MLTCDHMVFLKTHKLLQDVMQHVCRKVNLVGRQEVESRTETVVAEGPTSQASEDRLLFGLFAATLMLSSH